ncbi:MAG: ATP-binding protein [Xanthobacteraceae bacterium]
MSDENRVAPSPSARTPLGRVIAVSGSQATAQFPITTAMSEGGEFAFSVGSLVGIENGAALAIGALCDIALQVAAAGEAASSAIGRIDLLGQISAETRFQSGVAVYPKIGSTVVSIGTDDLKTIFDLASPSTVELGRLQQDASIAATVNVDETVRKHFAIFGSTGSGKSSALALILRKIMQARSDLRILLIDAHNEYTECFDGRAHVFGPQNLNLPFWLFNFEELVQIVFGSRSGAEREISLLADLIPLAKTECARASGMLRASYRAQQTDNASRFTADTPAPYRLEDVIAAAESRMGKLENRDLAVAYQRLIMRINAARRNPRYAFIFESAADTSDPMVEILCQLLRLKDHEQPMAIVQLAGFPAETTEVIVSVLFRLAFEFGVWSDGLSPVLIVCEEAQSYANADRDLGFRVAREGLSRIAVEGRKHGVFLGLITQRPHQLDPTLISQCSTVFAMRLGHEEDQKIIRAAVSDSASRLLAFLPSLGTREALVIGAGVPTVTRLRFEALPERSIPRSQAEWSGDLNRADKIDDRTISEIVARWRGTAPSTKPVSAPPLADLNAGDLVGWSAPSHR